MSFSLFKSGSYLSPIVLLFISFILLSNVSLPGRAYGETGYIEALQVILIISVLVVGFIRKIYLIKLYSRTAFWVRQSLFGFLLFEEISYLTTNKLDFLGYNEQLQLNFHNSRFLAEKFISFQLLNNDSISLNPFLVISALVVFLLYAGDRVFFLKGLKIISLHPFIRSGILFYLLSDEGPLKLAISYLVCNLFSFCNDFSIVNSELIELFLYLIFLADVIFKSYPRFGANSRKLN